METGVYVLVQLLYLLGKAEVRQVEPSALHFVLRLQNLYCCFTG